MTRPSPTIPLSRTTKHVMDAQGQWTKTEMHVWRDASGWHEIPARDVPAITKEPAHVGR